MSQVNSRVDDVEKALGDKISDAVGMLQELAATQRQQGDKLETVATETQTLANRIVDLEARLQAEQGGLDTPPTRWKTMRGTGSLPSSSEDGIRTNRGKKPWGRRKMSSENFSST